MKRHQRWIDHADRRPDRRRDAADPHRVLGQTPHEYAYVMIAYGPWTYWVDRNDFDSKYAFTVVQNLMALAEARYEQQGAGVAIPAN